MEKSGKIRAKIIRKKRKKKRNKRSGMIRKIEEEVGHILSKRKYGKSLEEKDIKDLELIKYEQYLL